MNSYPSRRNFIKKGSIFLAGAAISGQLFLQKEKFHIPLQLYSVRDEMKKDPLGTLKQLASIGYKEVEPAAYLEQSVYQNRKIYGYSSKELRKILDDLGLTQPSSHVVFRLTDWLTDKKDVSDEWKGVMEDANILGQKYLISPWFAYDKTKLDECRKGFDVYNKVGEICSNAGLRFGFHNHHDEFEQKFNNEYLYDIMLKELNLKYVCQQLDICNMAEANVDPMRWLKMFPKHFELLHVKDLNKTKNESTLLGDGRLRMKEILDFAKKNTAVKYWVIEQESYGDKTPMESVKIDLERLKQNYNFV
ncbi:sugar phosphate isomerase/epimerase [Cytophagaceae bacterium YF14B1]|uniref:Sugar phosphate isomerase/epimerase n=1 Tax=Xanthocytophaga flava TaxID=3048013 RepID=A0AAE3U966_9BACT|nr:sugar phosphate isomerase/epimerase [Xanthocytophaga flavus]MDJ1484739.1 sugar phosphate isomerase/epimerase [Xanthocytophaga flavus]